MATEAEIRTRILEPMQRYWAAPRGMDEASLEFQTSEFQDWCKQHSVEVLEAAYRWLQENYTFGHWPKIADWRKALEAIQPKHAAGSGDRKDYPWAQRDRQAEAIFRATYANTAFAKEMREGRAFQDYRALMRSVIAADLRRGGSGHHCEISSAMTEALRRRCRTYREAEEFRGSDAYQRVHGSGFDFARAYPSRRGTA